MDCGDHTTNVAEFIINNGTEEKERSESNKTMKQTKPQMHYGAYCPLSEYHSTMKKMMIIINNFCVYFHKKDVWFCFFQTSTNVLPILVFMEHVTMASIAMFASVKQATPVKIAIQVRRHRAHQTISTWISTAAFLLDALVIISRLYYCNSS